MAFITDPETGAQVWDGSTNPSAGRASIRDTLSDHATQMNGDGARNIQLGSGALAALTSGTANLAVGQTALAAVTTGSLNVCVGDAAGEAITTGGSNIGVGADAIEDVTTGSHNIAIGDSAMEFVTTTSSNIAIGGGAGARLADNSTNTSPTGCIYIGRAVTAGAASATNEVVIGYLASGNGANTTTIGSSSTTRTYLKGAVDCSGGPVILKSYAKASLPAAASYTGAMIYVTDDVGGATPAFSDGTNWRRTADRNVIS